jgi:hypothetical protein
MFPRSLSLEIKRIMTALFQQGDWHVCILAGSESIIVTANQTVLLDSELATGLHLFINGQSQDQLFDLPPFNYLFDSISPIYAHSAIGMISKISNYTILAISSKKDAAFIPAFCNLWKMKHQEIVYRDQIAQMLEQQRHEIHQLKVTLESFQLESKKTIHNWISNWMYLHPDYHIRLEESCIDTLQTFHSEKAIHQQLSHALSVAQFIYPNATQLTLLPAYFAELNQIEHEDTNFPVRRSLHERVSVLLDKYEAAALLCTQKNEPISGKSVACNLNPSVSPPAITDALKKNKKTIRTLLQMYPEKWQLIRTGLKPIKEIHENQMSIIA